MTTPADFSSSIRRSQDRAGRRVMAAHQPMTYRLDVIGSDVPDIVRSAGGWLFDHVMAGWHITVDIDAVEDARPLQILGVVSNPRTIDSASDQHAIIALPAHIIDGDDAVRAKVTTALRTGVDEVIVWGRSTEAEAEHGHRFREMRYALSAAGRAFKAQAMIAAGIRADASDSVEVLRSSFATLPSA